MTLRSHSKSSCFLHVPVFFQHSTLIGLLQIDTLRMLCRASDMHSRQRRPNNNHSCVWAYLHPHLGLADNVTHCITAAVDVVGLFCGAKQNQSKLLTWAWCSPQLAMRLPSYDAAWCKHTRLFLSSSKYWLWSLLRITFFYGLDLRCSFPMIHKFAELSKIALHACAWYLPEACTCCHRR